MILIKLASVYKNASEGYLKHSHATHLDINKPNSRLTTSGVEGFHCRQ